MQGTRRKQRGIIELRQVYKNFGNTEIIRGVDLQIETGERHAIIGPNGAGKSTLYNLISGRFPLTAGSVALRGKDITNLPPYKINRMGLSRSFQVTNIFPRMSVFENVRCSLLWSMGYKYSFWQLVDRQKGLNEKADQVLVEINMSERRDMPAGVLAYAEQRALEIGITIAGGADVILLDEPTEGLAPKVVEQVAGLLAEIARRGISILLVEQKLTIALQISQRVYVMGHGQMVFEGTPEQLRDNHQVRAEWLEV